MKKLISMISMASVLSGCGGHDCTYLTKNYAIVTNQTQLDLKIKTCTPTIAFGTVGMTESILEISSMAQQSEVILPYDRVHQEYNDWDKENQTCRGPNGQQKWRDFKLSTESFVLYNLCKDEAHSIIYITNKADGCPAGTVPQTTPDDCPLK